jgi:uncharacterized protein YcbK (DUF882 family)
MVVGLQDVGRASILFKKTKKYLASAAVAGAMALGLWGSASTTMAGGETRTLSIYHTHTKESLTVTYMINGKYVPSAMKKLNYILRDWRRNEVITIDPKTINLMWELHADLGSKRPVHIVSGYRSPKTNAFLKRIGRNVARKSQHMKGKAIDIYFPDVNTKTMRNSALVRLVGGVGYYRSGGGPSGFLHIDSGNVRHWGPGISRREMASIFSKYKRTVGARLSAKDRVMVASSDSFKGKAKSTGPSIYDGLGDEVDSASAEQMASLVQSTSNEEDGADEGSTAAAPVQEQDGAAADVLADAANAGSAVPKPRAKPIEVLMMAAANMQIEPASAPPPSFGDRKRPLIAGVTLKTVDEPSIDDAIAEGDQITNKSGKGSFAEDLNAIKPAQRKARPVLASAGSEINWWPEAQAATTEEQPVVLDGTATAPAQTDSQFAIIEDTGTASDGKGDLLVIDRSGKGSLPAPLPALIKG